MVWTICYVDKMVLDKMVADKMVRTKWHGQNVKLTKCYQTKTKGYGQNGTDKLVRTKCYATNV